VFDCGDEGAVQDFRFALQSRWECTVLGYYTVISGNFLLMSNLQGSKILEGEWNR